jgi:hypothetical protein
MSDIPLTWSREASKIVVGGNVLKNRTDFSAESIGMPIGGPGSETGLVTQEMVDYEEPGDWTYLSLSSLHDEILVSITRDDAGCGQRWVEYLVDRLSMHSRAFRQRLNSVNGVPSITAWSKAK